MRNRLLAFALVPVLAAAVWAETGWTHAGPKWTHSECKLSLNVPDGMTGELDKDGDLSVKSDGAQVMLLPTNDGALATKALQAMTSELAKGNAKLNMGELHKTEVPNGHVEAYATQTVSDGTTIDLTAGTLSQKGHYVVFMTVVAHMDGPKKQVDSLMDSISFAD